MTGTIQNGKGKPTDAQVREAMQDAWDSFCDDAQAIPGDIRRKGRNTYFVAGVWADHTAMALRAILSRHSLAREPATADVEREWPDIGTDPMQNTPYEDRMAVSAEAIRKAYTVQQPIVPNQTALVWRWHLMALLEAEIRLRSILADDAAPSSEPAIAEGERLPDRSDIARVLFDQRQTQHDFDDAAEADAESDAGTLYSICHDDADAVLALAQSSTPPASKGVEVPAGWKLVPIEPDEAMREKGGVACRLQYGERAVWSVMLAASPTPSNDTLQGRGE